MLHHTEQVVLLGLLSAHMSETLGQTEKLWKKLLRTLLTLTDVEQSVYACVTRDGVCVLTRYKQWC